MTAETAQSLIQDGRVYGPPAAYKGRPCRYPAHGGWRYLSSWKCIECCIINIDKGDNRERSRTAVRKHRNKSEATAEHQLWQRRRNLRFFYKITLGEYNEILAAQGGVCAICGGTDESKLGHLSVDHCHDTKKIRGLLCGKCNVALGNFKDSVANLAKAIQYLERFR